MATGSSPSARPGSSGTQVGGIGIAPAGNIDEATGRALFEATHGIAAKYANFDKVNPGSGDMMLRHLGWHEAAGLVVKSMEGATLVSWAGFGRAIVEHIGTGAPGGARFLRRVTVCDLNRARPARPFDQERSDAAWHERRSGSSVPG